MLSVQTQIQKFSAASGLIASKEKSTIYVAGMDEKLGKEIADAVAMPLGEVPWSTIISQKVDNCSM